MRQRTRRVLPAVVLFAALASAAAAAQHRVGHVDAVALPAAPAAPWTDSGQQPAAPPAAQAIDTELPARMREVMRHPTLVDATVGMLVVDATSGERLVEHNAGELFSPASVNKLFTAATALWRLGAAFTWQTPLAITGELRDGVIDGDLWALGRGAPDTVEEQLWVAARAIHRQGVRRIDGDIIVDDSYFDAERYADGWPGGRQVREAYHAPIGALMANYSAYREGNEWVAVTDPGLHFGERLHELLGLAGVEVTGSVRRPDIDETAILDAGEIDPSSARAGLPEELTLLHTIRSEPLGRLVLDVNKFSNNIMAETILKTLGAIEYGDPGTTEKGLAVAAKFRSESFGTELTGYVQADGSGLSRLNRVTPQQVVELLQFAYTDFHLGPEFVASMKISGRDGFNPPPFRHAPLIDEMRLKSGHIRGVNTLSGYAHTTSGRVVAFCVMVNDHRSQQWEIDQRVAELSQVILTSY